MENSFWQNLAGSQWVQLLPIILIFVVFIVLFIVPQKKREKKVKEMLNAMKVGDHVKTIGGILGKIVAVKEDIVVIESGPEGHKIEFVKGAIATVESADVEAPDISK